MNSIGIDNTKAERLTAELNTLLANYQLFYQNLRAFHWNVKGEQFFELHTKFEEMYTMANESIDEIAERILTLEGQPISFFSGYLENAEIVEQVDLHTGKDMVAATLEGLKKLIAIERSILANASDVEDEGTVALMSDYIKIQEKDIWMLRTYLS